MANEATTRRIEGNPLGKLVGPAVMLAGIAWIVHVVRAGTMFDDLLSVGLVGLALVVILFGVLITRTVMRAVVLEGPCPNCGVVAIRQFDKPSDPKSSPLPCGACIAYLRGTGGVVREEAIDALDLIQVNYELTWDQYGPAVKASSGRYFKFIMPKMCAVCGDPNAPHALVIDNANSGSAHDLDFLTQNHVINNPTAKIEPTEDDKRNDKLSNLRVPVCDKHADKFDFRRALSAFGGTLRFASYRYYKAFCEVNQITQASQPKKAA